MLSASPWEVAGADIPAVAQSVVPAQSVAPRWQNTTNPPDVSGDGNLTPYDALLVIYDLYTRGPHTLVGMTPPAAPGTVVLDAYVATVSGTPFGFDASVLNQDVSLTFVYDSSTPDSNPASDRGDYVHTSGGGFTADVLGTIITGSATPTLEIEDINGADTFRFWDGPRPIGPQGGVISVDGLANPNAQLLIAFTDGTGNAFSSDALPAVLPFAVPPLSMPSPSFFAHTISLSDENGTLLLQLNDLQPGQGPPYLDVDGDNDVDQVDAAMVINALFSSLPAPAPAAPPAAATRSVDTAPADNPMATEAPTEAADVSAEVLDVEVAAQASIRLTAEGEPSPAVEEAVPDADLDLPVEETDRYFAATSETGSDDEEEILGGGKDDASEVDAVFSDLGEPVAASQWSEEQTV